MDGGREGGISGWGPWSGSTGEILPPPPPPSLTLTCAHKAQVTADQDQDGGPIEVRGNRSHDRGQKQQLLIESGGMSARLRVRREPLATKGS